MRLVIILAIVAVALLWGGIQGVYTYLANPEPIRLTCAEYAERRPDAAWVHLSDCAPAVMEAVSLGFGGRIKELYVPLFPPDAHEDSLAVVLLATEDPVLLELFKELIAIEEAPETDDLEIDARLLGPVAAASRVREVKGLIQFGLELDDDDRDQIADHVGRAVTDFVIVDEDAEPELTWPATATGLGLLIAIGAVVLVRRKT